MSKVVRVIIGVGLIVAGVFMGGATWPLAVMALGGGIAASALQPKLNMPSVSSATAGRLNKSLEPEAHRKIAYGRTALGTDTRYWEAFGPDQKNYHEVIALAGCKIQSVDALYVEDELVTFNGSGGAIGKYAGSLSIAVSLEGVSGTALPGVGAGARWNVAAGQAASMTGCAHIALKWVWSQEKLPQGFPSRITPVGKGCLVYDPRRDSTRGGSGSHRVTTNPGDQSTWQYTPTDSNGEPIGRNPALQILQYILGWYIWNPTAEEFVLAHGMGVHPDDIDFASFITAANDCEAEGYYADCLLSTGDTHATNLAVLEQACAGVVSDVGGLYSLRIQVDDFGGSLVTFTDSDVVGDCDWRPEMPLSQSSYNQIAGQFIDPSALYQLRPMPLVRDAAYETADGDKSRTNVRLDAVQDGEQGQKLLRLMLNKSRRRGMFEAPFGWRAVNVRAGQPVKLSLSRFGFDERFFRVRARKVDPGGAVWLALEDDDPSVYAGGTVLPVPPAAVGAGYDRGLVPAPSVDDWTATGGSIGSPGFVEGPAITIGAGGAVSGLTGLTHILVDFRADGDTGWTHHGEFPLAGFEREQILGRLPNTSHDIRLRYRNAWGVIDDAQSTIIEGVVTGAQVAQSALDAAPGSALAQELDDRAREIRREAEDRLAETATLAAVLLSEARIRADDDSLQRFEIVEAQGSITTLDGVVSGQADAISGIDARVTSAEGTITAQGTAITAVEGRLDTVETDVDGLETTTTAQGSAISSLDGRVTSAEGTITAQGSALTALEAEIDDGTTGLNARALSTDLAIVEASASRSRARLLEDQSAQFAVALATQAILRESFADADSATNFRISRTRSELDGSIAEVIETTYTRSSLDTALGFYGLQISATSPSNALNLPDQFDSDVTGSFAATVEATYLATADAETSFAAYGLTLEAVGPQPNIPTELGALRDDLDDPNTGLPSRALITSLQDAEASASRSRARLLEDLEASIATALGAIRSLRDVTAEDGAVSALRIDETRATLNGVSAQVTDISNAVVDLETATATRIQTVEAGAAFAGVSFLAKDSDGDITADIRFAAQVIGFGETFAAPRFVIDTVGEEVVGLNAAGTVKTFQLGLDDGRLRLRSAAGALMFDAQEGGLLLDGVPANTITERWIVSSTGNIDATATSDNQLWVFLSTPYQNKDLVAAASFMCSGYLQRLSGSGSAIARLQVRSTASDGGAPFGDWTTLKSIGFSSSLPLSLFHFVGLIGEWWQVAITIEIATSGDSFRVANGYVEVEELRR